MTLRRLTLLICLCLGALGALGVSPASAATVWNLEMHHNPTDFSSSVAGSIEARTATQGSAGANEVQEVVLDAEAGEFKLTFKGKTTPELAFNATATVVQEALRALPPPSINGANVLVSRKASGATTTYTVTFLGALAKTDVPQIEAAQGSPPLTLAAHPQYWFDLDNVGGSPSSGEIKLTVHLPAGLTSVKVFANQEFRPLASPSWICSGETGAATVTCTTTGQVPRHTIVHLVLEVSVEAGLPEGVPFSATATLEGGGAASPVGDSEPAEVSSTPAGFGIVASSFAPDFFKADGIETEREAGAHPKLLVVPVDFNTTETGKTKAEGTLHLTREAESLRDLRTDLPPGFLGDPTAVGECDAAQFTVGACPPSSQVGRFDGSIASPADGLAYNFATGVFNMVHPRGAVTDLAFELNGNPVHVKASLDPANRYAIVTKLADINETFPPFNGKVTIWGVPAEASHDSERCPGFFSVGNSGNTTEECEAEHAEAPFLTMPEQCEADNAFGLHEYDSWQNTGVFGPEIDYTEPGHMTGCGKPVFKPEVSIEPSRHQAASPTGVNLQIHVPQNEEPDEPSTPPIKETTVTLPAGMAVNPALADGLVGCTEAQFGISDEGVPNANAIECPDGSRIGEVSITTPLLPNPVEGSMYLARQEENPFHSLLALYLAVHDTEERGVLVKVPLKIELNPVTGQITTTATGLPQFPFEDLTLKFRSDDRAPLVNPASCGSHTIEATMASYARPNEKINVSNTFGVSEGAGGGSCPASLSQRPFNPQLSAGTENPTAGAFSPFSVRVFRTDADQELQSGEGIAPQGLLASLRGVSQCSNAQIAAAAARNHPGEGALEQASPSCPANSQIGIVQTGAGAGPNPVYVPGKIYMAGPYEGAPLSGVAIVPAIAGPVDLGNVVVRAPAYVNPETAQVRIKTDPLPQVIDGILIRVKDVRIHLDRPGFTLNPTNCDPKAIDATLHSTEGASKNDSQRFQVGGCAAMGFKPNLQIDLKGGTKRGRFPALTATVTPRPGDANFSSAVVTLPHSAFLEQGHFGTICTRVQFAAGGGNGEQCPAASIYGEARATTPLLDETLEGPVFLRSSSHNLPDLVVALHGIIDVDLVSRIDSHKGGIRSSFEFIPDAPVSKFTLEMQGGKKGLIVNSTDLCRKPKANRADAKLAAQNGRLDAIEPLLSAKCPKAKKHVRGHKRHRGASR